MSDPIRQLQVSAQNAARHLTGAQADRVVVFDLAGRKLLDMAVPVTSVAAGGGGGEEPEAAEAGWSERKGRVYFDGTLVPLSGRKLDLLKVLIREDVADVDQLRPAWKGSVVEVKTIQWTVGELKKSLKELFGDFPGDIIVPTGSGYSLQLR
ncbi:hypothetical protein [Gemmata sp.]|uniref:hypothetical protein n=1 Tax=Gemmata sp. TaxID=1914242 RepID=UPI003F716D2C